MAHTLQNDNDQQETREWVDALDAVVEKVGLERADFLVQSMVARARYHGADVPYSLNTTYINTIPVARQQACAGDPGMEWKLRSLTRWNAMCTVINANRSNPDLGGHIASFASSATLYDVGFNHFFRGGEDGDLVYIQGHSAPGIYARAYLEGRLDEKDLKRFRREVGGGLSSYPHPRLMPNFWSFPTVSMGLSPIMSIYQARFMHYLQNREMIPRNDRKVWAFMGDGEMDEPESMGAIGMAGRERLDNLVFVVNCNLQRLDGPVRGNGKIIQELESEFRGANWNVIKVIWGSYWDPLLARDTHGLLRKRMEEVVDGDYQAYKAHGGAYVREHFFGKYPELLDMVSTMSDEDIWHLNRGGHDPHKIYAAYHAATHHAGQPTVILVKTVKGYGMGESGEGQNITHQQKKMGEAALKKFRDRFDIPVTDEQIADMPFSRPEQGSSESDYIKQRREQLGGTLFMQRPEPESLAIPDLKVQEKMLESSGERELSTTMAFVRILTTLLRDQEIGPRIVPIIPDEARTFGMESLFRKLGIYSPVGQLYEPVDHDQVMYYREDRKGQILEEGLNEAGAFSSWIAAGTASRSHGLDMIPFYVFYSMFGFQRIGDLAWAAGDMRTRGFLIGGTAGRTTLNGEGLQHQDGHSHLLASTVPCCVAYDPAYAYELAVIIHDGLRRMYLEREDIYYYITVMNEKYKQPAMPKGSEQGILHGMHRIRGDGKDKKRLQLFGSGTILLEVLHAADMLQKDFGIASDVWSVTSYNELRKEGMASDRWNMLHPGSKPRNNWVQQQLGKHTGPVVAASDYMRAVAEQIRAWINGNYVVLGTDGFGRSDTREALRSYFEVDRYHIVLAALHALQGQGGITTDKIKQAMKKYHIKGNAPDPAAF
ncbi:MAG: pyruvate dehydrogenase (acetyl-transferring), homodimeric type [Candidatus Porifericomitaceae bacterium WSBS_2022_MAG_OTU9]